ncbi:MAG: hypothetical protein ABL929_05040 [Ferruginibacter sp.]|nr:hypothetical protein [Ferruginibacter sp.]
MKKFMFVVFLSFATVVTTNSCSNVISSISKAVLTKIGNSLIGNVGDMLQNSGVGNLASRLNLDSKVGSIIKNPILAIAFKGLIANKYQIPLNKIESAYSSFSTLKSVATFIGNNASKEVIDSL